MELKAAIKHEGFKLTKEMAIRPAGLFSRQDNAIHTARRDWASFAAVVYSKDDMLFSVTGAPAFSPSASAIAVRAEADCPGLGAVSVSVVWMVDDDDSMHKADLICQGDYFPLPGMRAHQLRLSVDIPESAAAGCYGGALRFYSHRLFEDETEIIALGFFIHVHNVLLPKAREGNFYLDLWQHVSNIARKHETPLFSDAHFRVLEGYVRTLAELGQKAVTIIASEIPWSGQRCFNDREYPSDLFEYNMVRVVKTKNGKFLYDYSVVQRYIELCFSYGIDREIEIFGLCNIWLDEAKGYGSVADWPDGIRIRYYDEGNGKYSYLRKASEITGYIAALQEFLERRGWLYRALVVADEPADTAKFDRSLAAIRQAAPRFRFKAAINHAEFIGKYVGVVSDYVPYLEAVAKEWELLQQVRGGISGNLLYYVCCCPLYPNTFLCSPLSEGRLIPLLAAYLGMDGFLRWNYTVWPENPRERLSYRTGGWWSGDTCFVYPSRGGEPLLSLRYFALKRGIGDFELVKMAMALSGGSDAILPLWSRILRKTSISGWSFDEDADRNAMYSAEWADYEQFRRELLEYLETTT